MATRSKPDPERAAARSRPGTARAERVEIGAAVDHPAADQLGGTGTRACRPARRVGSLSHVASVDSDFARPKSSTFTRSRPCLTMIMHVRRLEIAMHDVDCVGGLERLQSERRWRRPRRARAAIRLEHRQRACAVDELHHEEGQAAVVWPKSITPTAPPERAARELCLAQERASRIRSLHEARIRRPSARHSRFTKRCAAKTVPMPPSPILSAKKKGHPARGRSGDRRGARAARGGSCRSPGQRSPPANDFSQVGQNSSPAAPQRQDIQRANPTQKVATRALRRTQTVKADRVGPCTLCSPAMKIVVAERYGGPDAFGIVDRSEPEPGAKDVVIRVKSCEPEPDRLQDPRGQAQAGLPVRPPIALGCDVAGVVAATGGDVTGFACRRRGVSRGSRRTAWAGSPSTSVADRERGRAQSRRAPRSRRRPRCRSPG